MRGKGLGFQGFKVSGLTALSGVSRFKGYRFKFRVLQFEGSKASDRCHERGFSNSNFLRV